MPIPAPLPEAGRQREHKGSALIRTSEGLSHTGISVEPIRLNQKEAGGRSQWQAQVGHEMPTGVHKNSLPFSTVKAVSCSPTSTGDVPTDHQPLRLLKRVVRSGRAVLMTCQTCGLSVNLRGQSHRPGCKKETNKKKIQHWLLLRVPLLWRSAPSHRSQGNLIDAERLSARGPADQKNKRSTHKSKELPSAYA